MTDVFTYGVTLAKKERDGFSDIRTAAVQAGKGSTRSLSGETALLNRRGPGPRRKDTVDSLWSQHESGAAEKG